MHILTNMKQICKSFMFFSPLCFTDSGTSLDYSMKPGTQLIQPSKTQEMGTLSQEIHQLNICEENVFPFAQRICSTVQMQAELSWFEDIRISSVFVCWFEEIYISSVFVCTLIDSALFWCWIYILVWSELLYTFGSCILLKNIS